jgi:uncharacterized protein YyaL (SSP411 family)
MNKLSSESSPYLLQHQSNPVDWYPWGEEALSKAKLENKPILLSVGYSACHWCHVMAHESFENLEIAALMNERFINIKVDREERPDLDQIYQNVAQAMTRSGGWPLTVFLTPELQPFFGGTYYPPEDRYGRPGFPRLLKALSDAYKNEPESIAENAQKLTDFIRSMDHSEKSAGLLPNAPALQKSVETLIRSVDWSEGGIGSAPKFPNPMVFDFLWRMGTTYQNEKAGAAVILTLQKMASGGIYDQLGGGFHRYSVDETWSVPHFEKMLYDNGLLLRTYSQVLLSEGVSYDEATRALFLSVVRETVDYLLREMQAPGGAFYAAQDADTEEGEGEYFAWNPEQLKAALSPREAAAVADFYGVNEQGNFEHGKTVLFRAHGILAAPAELSALRKRLFDLRTHRIAPGTDDKILASWNGLAISGLAWASRALSAAGDTQGSEKAWDAASGAFRFVTENLSREGDKLWSVFSGGKPKLNAYLDDYAFLSQAALDLARFEPHAEARAGFIAQAEKWIEVILGNFSDSEKAGYFFTSSDHESLIHRPKTAYDQAIPSGTAVVVGCLIALAEIDASGQAPRYLKEAERQLAELFSVASQRAYGQGELLNASLLYTLGPVAITAPESSDVARAITHPFVFTKGDTGSYLVCHRGTCGLPLSSPEEAGQAALQALGV